MQPDSQKNNISKKGLKVVPLTIEHNRDAVDLLKAMIKKVESGEVVSVAVAYVARGGSIGGDVSAGENNISIWAALEHTARHCYSEMINEQ